MSEELHFKDLSISYNVLKAIIEHAVLKVDGVLKVQELKNLDKDTAEHQAIQINFQNEGYTVKVFVVVEFGYNFKDLAKSVRQAVYAALLCQLGDAPQAVDVVIDHIVFSKDA